MAWKETTGWTVGKDPKRNEARENTDREYEFSKLYQKSQVIDSNQDQGRRKITGELALLAAKTLSKQNQRVITTH